MAHLLFTILVLLSSSVTAAPYLDPLQRRIEAMQDQLNSVMSAVPTAGSTPVAHVYGQFSGRYSSGSYLKRWNSHGSLSHSPILAGGMTLIDDGIVVPFTGVYYVYGQLQLDPHSGDSDCSFRLFAGSSYVEAYTNSKTKTGSEDHTKYTGETRLLKQGDVIRIYISSTCTLDYFHSGETFLGAIFVSFSFLDNGGPPASFQYGYYSGTRSSGSYLPSWSSLLRQGGAYQHSSIGFRVPKRGFYYVFGQQQLDPKSSNQDCGFYLKQDSSSSRLASTYIRSYQADYDERTEYTGLVADVSANSYLRIYSIFSNCYFYNRLSYGSYFGAFYLPFQNGPIAHLIGSFSGTYTKGTILTGRWSSNLVSGDIRLDKNSRGFVVPTDGVYYVYAQIHMIPTSSSMKQCAYELKSSSSFGSRVIAAGVSFVPSPARRDKVVHTGAAASLNAGSVVYVKMRGTCSLRHIGGKEQFLGGFYLGHSSTL